MDVRDRINRALLQARDRQDAFATEVWSAALAAFSSPVPPYDMEEQRRQLLHNLDRHGGRYA